MSNEPRPSIFTVPGIYKVIHLDNTLCNNIYNNNNIQEIPVMFRKMEQSLHV